MENGSIRERTASSGRLDSLGWSLTSTLLQIALLILSVPLPSLLAQSQEAGSQDPRLEEAQRKQAIAEAEKATAEAERDALKAKIGELTAKTPEGKITLGEHVEIEALMLAYRAADRAAERIAAEVTAVNPKPTRIVIYGKEVGDIMFYKAYQQQRILLEKEKPSEKLPTLVTDNLPKPCKLEPRVEMFVAPPLLVAGAALQALSLIKTDISVSGVSFTPDEMALTALVAKKLKDRNISVIYPSVFYPDLFARSSQPQIYTDIANLYESRLAATNRLIPEAEQKKTDLRQRAAREEDENCKALYQADLETLDRYIDQAKSFTAHVDALASALLKVEDQSGARLLETLARAELLMSKAGSDARILALKFVAAGGSNKTTTNIWGSKLYFSGGTAVAYMMFSADGSVSTSGVVSEFGCYVRDRDLNKVLIGNDTKPCQQ